MLSQRCVSSTTLSSGVALRGGYGAGIMILPSTNNNKGNTINSMNNSSALLLRHSVRHQTADLFHNYLNNPTIVQGEGLEHMFQTRAAQQDWNNTEQFEGYSDTYLKRPMTYMINEDAYRSHSNDNPIRSVDRCLQVCYEVYGPAADILESLYQDPLQTAFNKRMEQVAVYKEKLEKAIDEVYATVHPTEKLFIDNLLVRRFYFLDDFAGAAQKKRDAILERLSPEQLKHANAARGLADRSKTQLQMIRNVMEDNIDVALLEDMGFSELELVAVKQKANYYRNMKRVGMMMHVADTQI